MRPSRPLMIYSSDAGSMNHRIGRLVFGIGAGFLVAFLAFRWVSDTSSRAERVAEELAVNAARVTLESTLGISDLEIVDPLAPDRSVGKTYVYPAEPGWQVSGYYRRSATDLWHPYLVTLDENLRLSRLRISDSALRSRDGERGVLEVLP